MLFRSLTGVISGTGSITKSGSGILTLAATNTYSGATTISSGGILQLGKANAIPAASDLTVDGTLNLNGFDLTINSLSGSGTIANYGGYDIYSPSSGTLLNGLILFLDAGNPLSYSGSGTTWTDLSTTGSNATLVSPSYNSSAGSFNFVDSSTTAIGSRYAYLTANNTNFKDFTNGLTIFSNVSFGGANFYERKIGRAHV